MTPLCQAAQAELPIGWADVVHDHVGATVGGVYIEAERRKDRWVVDAWISDVCLASDPSPTLRDAFGSILSESAPEPGPGWQPDDLAKRDRILAVLRGVLERAT